MWATFFMLAHVCMCVCVVRVSNFIFYWFVKSAELKIPILFNWPQTPSSVLAVAVRI